MKDMDELIKKYNLRPFVDDNLTFPHTVYQQMTFDGKNVISHNFVVKYNKLLQGKLIDSNNLEESFYAFEKEYFSKYFFREDTDLKWNYYLIIIVSEEESVDPEICQLEDDDRFLRKLVMTPDEFRIYLDPRKRNENNSGKSINGMDLYAQWQRELSAVNLEGILFVPYESRRVRDYLENGTPIRGQGRPIVNWEVSDEADLKYTIQKLNSVSIKDFRNHCLVTGLQIPLSKVNLIYGHNGTGKSSICSAIELAVTGDIADTGNEIGAAAADITNRDNDCEQLSSGMSNKDKKALAKLWYGTTVNARNGNLNRNFHTFNYLGLEAAGKYMQNIEVDNLVRDVLFGNEVTEAESKMDRYGKEFAEQKKGYEKRLKELSHKLDDVTDSMKALPNMDQTSSDKIINYLRELGYKEELPQNKQDVDEEFLKEIKSLIVQNEHYVEFLFNKCDAGETGALIRNKTAELNKDRDFNNELNEKRAEIEQQMVICQTQIDANNELLQSLYDRENALQSLLERGEKMEGCFFSNKDFTRLRREYDVMRSQKEDLEQWLEHYHGYMETEMTNPELENEIYKKKNAIRRLTKEIDEISSRIDQQRVQDDDLQVLIFEISNLIEGNSGLNKHIQSCPLCGTAFTSNERLMEAVNRQKEYRNFSQGIVQTLIVEKDNMVRQLHEEQDALKHLEVQNENVRQVRMATEYLQGIIPLEKEMTGGEIIREVQRRLEEFQKWLDNHTEKYRYVQQVMESKIFYDYLETDEWISYLRKSLQQVDENVEATRVALWEASERTLDLKKEDEKLIQICIMFPENKWREYQQKQSSLEALNRIWTVVDDVPIHNWLQKYNELVHMVNYLEEILETLRFNNMKENQIRGLVWEINKLEEEYKRCVIASSAIARQKHLKDTMEEFLSENAKQIELFFKLLHRPKEFGTLQIKNGNISIVRKSNGQSVESRQMSTGQRMALAFSVMITLHFKAANAPNFLMLDEPVANLDDMHVLNLIDLLRDMAISGTQIIMTTANDQIAKFLRRKFSFLEEEYSHFELTRKGSEQTQIDIIHYSYDQKKETSRRRLLQGE